MTLTRRAVLRGLAQIVALGPLAMRSPPRVCSAARAGIHAQVYISTIGPVPRDYATFSAWEAATDCDLVTATDGEVAECYGAALLEEKP